MKKTLLLSIIIAVIFSGCFSVSKLNSFSKDNKSTKIERDLPDNAPSWVYEANKKGFITQNGVAYNIDEKELTFHKQKALINASHNLTKKIYIKTKKLYIDYEDKKDISPAYDKDIKKFSEHIALKALTHSKIVDTWISDENSLFMRIAVDSSIVTKQIQQTSKLLFKVDQHLYKNFLSNRAEKDINNELQN
jgi:hypothetical protein